MNSKVVKRELDLAYNHYKVAELEDDELTRYITLVTDINKNIVKDYVVVKSKQNKAYLDKMHYEFYNKTE